jgi:hypothetical protein
VVPGIGARRLGAFRQVLVGETSQPAAGPPPSNHFSLFSGIGTHLELNRTSTRDEERAKKGRLEMSGQSKFSQTLIAAVGAVLLSSVAVGAAVGPAQAVASPVGVDLHA